MNEWLQVIMRRKSCRNYSDRPLDRPLLDRIDALLGQTWTGPFGGSVRFVLLRFGGATGAGDGGSARRAGEAAGDGGNGWPAGERLGTYGFIRNARWYVAGLTREGEWAGVDFGYCLEQVVLELTVMGLGTCWMAGTYNKGTVRSLASPAADEIIPAVTPVGYPADAETLLGRMIKRSARSASRRSWEQLFWDSRAGRPLSAGAASAAGAFAGPLEAVRLAPSAANRQPWRAAVDAVAGECGLYSVARPSVDLGIAMRHFELVARDEGLPGGWVRLDPPRPAGPVPAHAYVATWSAGTQGGR